MIRAVIFDFFGVIRPDRLILAYRQFGGDAERDEQLINDAINASNRGLIPSSRSVLAKHLGVSQEAWLEAIHGGVTNDAQLLAYIKSLRQTYRTGLLSNIGKNRLEDLFAAGELEVCFDIAVGSGDIGFAKPEARAYEIIAERLGVRLEECIFTDDRPEYCIAARAVGMQAIEYRTFDKFQTDLENILNR